MDYHLVKVLGNKVVVLEHWQYGTAIWSTGVLRKPKSCAVCRNSLEKGTEAYRPMTNKTFRADRVCVRCMGKLTQPKEGHDKS